MEYEIFIRLEAVQDYKDGINWYRKIQVTGLVLKFTYSVKQAISKIEKYPNAFAIRYKNVRVAHLSKFPYAIHYFIDGNKIIIIAIIYSGRDPQISLDRS